MGQNIFLFNNIFLKTYLFVFWPGIADFWWLFWQIVESQFFVDNLFMLEVLKLNWQGCRLVASCWRPAAAQTAWRAGAVCGKKFLEKQNVLLGPAGAGPADYFALLHWHWTGKILLFAQWATVCAAVLWLPALAKSVEKAKKEGAGSTL